MKNKSVFKIAFISVLIFIIVATYFWYLYFKNGIGKNLESNIRLEVSNSGGINYINASPSDSDDKIPTYYFKINNKGDNETSYNLYFEKTNVSDGCTDATNFLPSELNYELKLDNRVVSSGIVSDIKDNLIYTNSISGNKKDSYALRVWLNNTAESSPSKHFHYIINIKEK